MRGNIRTAKNPTRPRRNPTRLHPEDADHHMWRSRWYLADGDEDLRSSRNHDACTRFHEERENPLDNILTVGHQFQARSRILTREDPTQSTACLGLAQCQVGVGGDEEERDSSRPALDSPGLFAGVPAPMRMLYTNDCLPDVNADRVEPAHRHSALSECRGALLQPWCAFLA